MKTEKSPLTFNRTILILCLAILAFASQTSSKAVPPHRQFVSSNMTFSASSLTLAPSSSLSAGSSSAFVEGPVIVTGDDLNIGPSSGYLVNILNGNHSSIAGGAFGETDTDYDFIGAGFANQVSDIMSGILAGSGNYITASNCFIGSGAGNFIDSSLGYAYDSAVGSGYHNYIATEYAFIGAGADNNVLGDGGFIGSGYFNTINGDYASVGGGSYNVASGTFSCIFGGTYANANSYCQYAHANTAFLNPANSYAVYGSSQTSEFLLSRTTISGTTTELFLDGDTASHRIVFPFNGTWTFQLLVTARSANGESGGFQANGVIKNVNGNTTFVGGGTTMAVPAIASDVAGWTVSAAIVNNALSVSVTGNSATNRWVARIHTAEVIY
jgi:hypothetical protein